VYINNLEAEKGQGRHVNINSTVVYLSVITPVVGADLFIYKTC